MIEIPVTLLEALRTARHVVVLTGAGISAESGVPTFREAQTGLWSKYDPQALATRAAFRRNPQLVWDWYQWRRDLINDVTPNPGHYALREMEEQVPRFTLITQNIDDLHRLAGSHNLIELHGNIHRSKCFEENIVVTDWEESDQHPPQCPRCGGLLRPDVVWFGEALPRDALEKAVAATYESDLFNSIGTSALVHPAASLPLQAVEQGAATVEINPQQTPITMWMDYVLQGPAGEILPALVEQAWGIEAE